MSWINSRPVFDKLPKVSGQWSDNIVVSWLTKYWDDMLVSTKARIDNPAYILGPNLDDSKLDFVGRFLCGYAGLWDSNLDNTQKRDLISVYPQAVLNRGSLIGCNALVNAICPGAYIQIFPAIKADFNKADLSYVGTSNPLYYVIRVPSSVIRGSKVWVNLEDAIYHMLPVGLVTIQYSQFLAGLSIAGDSPGL